MSPLPPARVLICGAGAIGSVYGSKILSLGAEGVALVADQERLARYRREGLSVNGRRHDFRLLAAGGSGPPAQFLLIAGKNHHLCLARIP